MRDAFQERNQGRLQMATLVARQSVPMNRELTLFQRMALRRFHPRAIMLQAPAALWALYYFWNHDWKLALGAYVVGMILALVSVANIDTVAMSKTKLGRLAFLHMNPVNYTVQVFGAIIALYGMWQYSAVYILSGVTLIFAGHMFGWEIVDDRFRDLD